MARKRVKYDAIKSLLTDLPHLREDVNFLLTHIWLKQAKENNLETISDFINAINNKTLWNADTIRRTRRLVIVDNPELKPSPEVQELHQHYEAVIRANGGTME